MINSPKFRALNREASLAAQLVCAGVTALRRANSAQTGIYQEAFFDLSIGLERMAKIAIIVDYCFENGGAFPSDSHLRTYGHKLGDLIDEVKKIRAKYPSTDPLICFPDDVIVRAIVARLSEFAVSSRYYNLDYLVSGKSIRQGFGDPIAEWFETVGRPILERHYKGAKRKRDESRATVLGGILDQSSMIRFTAEDGSPIEDAETMLRHSSISSVVQKWGQFHVLRILRYMSGLLSDLGREAHSPPHRHEFIPYFGDHFRIFYNEDRYLKSRRTWSPI